VRQLLYRQIPGDLKEEHPKHLEPFSFPDYYYRYYQILPEIRKEPKK